MRSLALLLPLAFLACAHPKLSGLSEKEIDALEVRHYQLPARKMFDRCEAWLLGSGWGIVYSDRSSGVIRTEWRAVPPSKLVAEIGAGAKKLAARRKVWLSIKALPNTQVALRAHLDEEFQRDPRSEWVSVDFPRHLAVKEYERLHDGLEKILLAP